VVNPGETVLSFITHPVMKKILVPTDFSACAQYAGRVAIAIAKKSGAELFFLHLEETVPEVAHMLSAHAPSIESQEGHARHQLLETVSQAEKEGVTAHGIFISNDKVEEIQDYIKPYNIDFLVMGSHGAKGIREAVIGSKTQNVIRQATVPALVIKQEQSFNPQRIVFASTFREDVTVALKEVAAFCAIWQAELHLVFVNLFYHLIEEEEAKYIMNEQMSHLPGVAYTTSITETNDEEWGITQFSKTIGADVIAVMLERPKGLSRLFNSSVAERLINHESSPVLVINPY
jgi:nucleotide-binding universal stress UspA family protein